MFLVAKQERFNKVSNMQAILSRIGEKVVDEPKRKIFMYKGLVWEFIYKQRGIWRSERVQWCIITAEQWKTPNHNRWTLQDVIKKVCEVRHSVSEDITSDEHDNDPYWEYYQGSRYEDDKRRVEDVVNTEGDLVEAIKRVLYRAAELDYYYQFVHDKD